MEEEQEAYDNLPGSLQASERGQVMQNAIDQMSEAIDSIEVAISCLESAHWST